MTCEELGFDLNPDQELSWSLGPPLHWCLEQLGIPRELMDQAVAIFERAHTERMHELRPIPGADAVIRELSATGIRIGVATIKPQPIAEHVLDTLGLREHIACVYGHSDDYDPRTKTDLLRLAHAELGAGDAIYVGDHDNDEVAARELSLPFLRYPDHSWDEVRAAVLGATADVP